MRLYKHAYTVAFLVLDSVEKNGSDVTPQQVHAAIIERANELLRDGDILSVVGDPFDTCTIEN